MEFPKPGELLSERFQLHEKLGEGGFAYVFRATDVDRPGVDLAVKVIKADSREGYSAQLMARFEREVAILSQLTNPHSVRLQGHGQTSAGLLYMAFDYVPGWDLSELLAERGRLEPDEVVSLLRQLLAALAEAHRLGLVHRDIKPANVRVAEQSDGSLVAGLLDFGIAKETTKPSAITDTGALVGTPRYMSPEQLRGRPVGPASDIYSLGVLAFELLGGQHALPGARLGDQIERMASGYVFSVPEIERIGPDLLGVLNRMTARAPDDRFGSASSVLHALDAADSDTRASPGREVRRKAPVMGVVVLGLIGVAIAITVAISSEEQHATPVPRTDVARAGVLLYGEEPAISTPDTGTHSTDMKRLGQNSIGCGQPAPFEEGVGVLIDEEQGDKWVVRLPRGYDPKKPSPMIVLFHQDGGGPDDIIRRTGFDQLADTHDIILAAPKGDHHLRQMAGLLGSVVEKVGELGEAAWRDDRSIVRAERHVQRTTEELCVDLERIFLVGHGSGGFAVNMLSCEPWVAGIAMNGYRRRADLFNCQPARPVPTLKLSVTQSGNSPAEGGRGCGMTPKLPIDVDEEGWRARNNCREPVTNTFDEDGHTCHRWTCDRPMEICRLDGGINWPGSSEDDFVGGPDCMEPLIEDFPGTERIWSFFEGL